MILPMALLLRYWIEHVTIGLPYVKFIVSTRKLYKGVPGLATDQSGRSSKVVALSLLQTLVAI